MEQKKQQAQSQRAKQDRADALASLQRLRRDGVLTRQQFRLLVWEKGLQTGVKGVPEFTSYEIVKEGKKKVPVTATKAWARI